MRRGLPERGTSFHNLLPLTERRARTSVQNLGTSLHRPIHHPVNCAGTFRSLRPNHQQAPSEAYGNMCSFPLQIPAKSHVENRLPTDGNPHERVVHSAPVTPVAQLADAAPIAPPQNLEAAE